MRNKKILGLLLAGVMVTSIPFNVFADEKPAEGATEPANKVEEPSDQGTGSGETTDPKEGEETTVEVTFKAVLVEAGKDNQTKDLNQLIKVNRGEVIPADNLKAQTKEGYEFGGWYSDEGLTKKFDATKKIEDTTIIYAKFTKKAEKFTVIFKDGDTEVSKTSVEKGKAVNEPTAPTKDGFEFVEWQKDGKKFDFETPINENIKLKAVWRTKAPETKTYTVTFYSKGGSTVATQTIEEGKTATEPKAPTRTGYTFKGWYTDNGKFVDKFDFTKPVTEDTTLYAKWEKIEEDKPAVPTKQDLYISDIEYDGNYVTGKVTSKGEAVKDATVTLKIDGSKTGYTDETDAYGRFKVYLGKYYDDYRYYDDDYYYRDGDRYYDGYRVYKDSDGDYYYIKNGKRNYIRYSNYYRRYRDYKADLVAEKSGFYSAEKNLLERWILLQQWKILWT